MPTETRFLCAASFSAFADCWEWIEKADCVWVIDVKWCLVQEEKKETERKMEKMRDESSDCARYMLILFSLAEQPGQSECAFKSDQSQNRSSTKILHTTVASGTSGKDNISLIHWFGYCSLNAFSCTVIFTGFQFRTIRSIAKIWWNWNMTIATRIWLLHAADVVWRKCTYTGYRWGE